MFHFPLKVINILTPAYRLKNRIKIPKKYYSLDIIEYNNYHQSDFFLYN